MHTTQILQALDAEIARLTKARELLADAPTRQYVTKRTMSAATRQKLARAMKNRWKQRKATARAARRAPTE